MDRRTFVLSSAIGAAALSTPMLGRAQVSSETPLFNGKRVRRRLSTLTNDDPFFAAYQKAIELMHIEPDTSPSSWIFQARTHADFCAHGDMEFFPWHRPYLSSFERICGKLIGDPNFALPYWDWRDNNGRLPSPFFAGSQLNPVTLNDSGSYMSMGWGQINSQPYRYARADFGLLDGPAAGTFAASAMDSMENASTFELLTGLTEQPHGTAHVVVGGDPAFGLGLEQGHFRNGLSPLDPIFWLHHANVDRIWAQSGIPVASQISAVDDPNKEYTGVFFDESGSAISPRLGDLFDFDSQSYVYDFMVPELLTAEAQAISAQAAAAQPQILAFAAANGIQERPFNSATEVLAEGTLQGETVVGAINRVSIEAASVSEQVTKQQLVPRSLPLLENTVAIDKGHVFAVFEDVKLSVVI